MGQRNIYERYAWFDSQVRAGRHPNASKLATRFEISVKTAQRDIEFMRDRMRCPLVYSTSEKGYYYEDGDFSLPVTYLSADELSSLVLAKRLLEDVQGDYLSHELEAVIGKISSILKDSVEGSHGVEDAVSIHLVGYVPVSDEVFGDILRACIHRQKISFSYYSPLTDQYTHRVAHPYHLFSYMGTWHMVAFCEKREDLRDFVLARVRDLSVQEDTFNRPGNFDVDSYMHATFGLFKGPATDEAILRFSPEQGRWVKSQVWHRAQRIDELKDGSVEMTLPVSNLNEIKMEVLKFGAGVEVVKPAVLREMVTQEVEKMRDLYALPRPAAGKAGNSK